MQRMIQRNIMGGIKNITERRGVEVVGFPVSTSKGGSSQRRLSVGTLTECDGFVLVLFVISGRWGP